MSKAQTSRLSDKQKRAIELMTAEGYSKMGCAIAIGISESTLYRWFKKNTEFSKAFYMAEKTAARPKNIREKHKEISEKALKRLCALMECGDPKTELAAAKEILIRLCGGTNEKKCENTEEAPSEDGLMEAVLSALRKD